MQADEIKTLDNFSLLLPSEGDIALRLFQTEKNKVPAIHFLFLCLHMGRPVAVVEGWELKGKWAFCSPFTQIFAS